MQARVLIVSPVRNEATHIERVVRAVAAQSCLPARWVVVDDGSTDGTLELLRSLEHEIEFLRVVERSPDDRDVPDRLAIGAVPRAFNVGLRHALDEEDFTHIVKLDGDIELPPYYLEQVLARFATDPQLGMAAGDLVEPRGPKLELLRIPRSHVHGALKCYTRVCFEAIGGMQECLGWDTIDETYARMRGFRTRSFPDIVALHHRPHASADGTLRGRARHGECAYIAHYSFVWVALRSFKVALDPPMGVSGAAFLAGYVRAALRRRPQVPDAEFRRFARREMRMRMVRAVFPPARLASGSSRAASRRRPVTPNSSGTQTASLTRCRQPREPEPSEAVDLRRRGR